MRRFAICVPVVAMLVSSSFHSPRAERVFHVSLAPGVPKKPVLVQDVNPLDTFPLPDSSLIVLLEGCTDTFIVPSHRSGPTISCGVDLNALGSDNVQAIFVGLVSPSTLKSIVHASKYRGAHARRWVHDTHIKLSDSTQRAVFRRALALIWQSVHGDELHACSPAAQASLLSYAYHTGHLPEDRRKLKDMSSKEIACLLKRKGISYRGSCKKSFRRRRLLEANFIERYSSLDAMAVRNVTISLSPS